MTLTQEQYETLKAMGLTGCENMAQNSLSGFVESCCREIPLERLMYFETEFPDRAELDTWGITEDDWRLGRKLALQQAMFEFEQAKRRERESALDELAQQAQELGMGYD